MNYTNDEITIVWESSLCTHSGICRHNLPDVFNPQKRPWIDVQGAPTEKIIALIKKCPSGALSYYMNYQKEKTMEKKKENYDCTPIEIMHNGPAIVKGCVFVQQQDKDDQRYEKGVAFCRCGKSKNQPFCNGAHMKNPFE
jgi:uncharacterized Fe-S cluster protein YjdI